MTWTKAEDLKLRELVAANRYFYTEMAPILKKTPQSIGWRVRWLALPRTRDSLRSRFGKWNSKHSHLREEVMAFFTKHSAKETCEQFNLTSSEFKSLMTIGYRLKKYRHLRKETRDHSPWSTRQLLFLLRHAGLRPRKWVAKKIGRGNQVCIKERLQALGLASRTLQGLTMSQFCQVFGSKPKFYLKTDAGPQGLRATHWRIVPWVWLNAELKSKRLNTTDELESIIETRAIFQDWVFGGNTLSKMKRIVRGQK